MSANIDNRVVSMKFDNKDFESNVKTSLGTLEKLNQTLNKADGAKAFDGLSKAAKGVTLDHIANGVETIQNKFSALSIVGITALQNLTNAAISAGTQMVKSLTIDPVTDGLAEYELKMGSVQTIMASTGKDLPTVNGYLAELNEYADKTIYSFSDMTSSIGKFTNNGVELEKAVRAIQGISNEAALSGANAQQASHAMYNFAQALSSGAVKLIDWKSIENANMATVEFKEELIKTALEMGTLVKQGDRYVSTTTDLNGKVSEAFTSTSMFNDSLSAQWMTSEVLVETLGRYADETTDLGKRAFGAAQDVKTFSQLMDTLREAVGSGWAETFELIIGDFDQAKALWTAVNNEISGILDAQAKARNELLRAWAGDELGGREALLDSFENVWNALKAVIKPVKEAFRDVFPPMTAQRLADMTKAIRDLTARLIISGETAELLRRTFRGLFAVVDIAKQVFSALGTVIRPLLRYLPGMGDGVLGFTAALGDNLYAFDQWLRKTEIFSAAAEKIAAVLSALREKITDAIAHFKSLFSGFDGIDLSGVDAFVDRLKERFQPIEGLLERTREVFHRAFAFFSKLSPVFQAIFRQIGNAFRTLGAALSSAFGEADFNALLDLINGGLLAAIGVGLKKFIASLTEISEYTGGLFSGIKEALNGVRECLTAYQQSLKADILWKIALAIGVLTLSLFVLSTIDSERLAAATLAIGALFSELVIAFGFVSKITAGGTLRGLPQLASSMIGLMGLAFAILTLAGAMRIIGGMDDAALVNSVTAIGALLAELLLFTKFFTANKGLMKGVASLILLGVALRMLVKPIQEIGDINREALIRGLTGLGVLLAELAFFLKFADFDGMGVTKGLGLILMAQALKIMASAVAEIGALDVNTLARGLTAIGAALLLIGGYSTLMSGTKHALSSAVSMLIISQALIVLSEAIREMGATEPETIVRGLVALASALAAIAGAMRLMPKNVLANAVVMVVIGGALKIITGVLADMGNMQMTEIGKGLLALGGALLAIAVAVRVMSGAMSGAAALLIVSAALAVIAPVLKALGSMSLIEVGIALLALAGTFVVLGVAGLALTPVVPVLIALGAAVTLLGVGLAVGAAATMLFATALAALAVSGAAGAAALAGAIVTIAGTIPAVMKQIGEGIAELIKSVGDNASVIVEAFVKIARTVIQGCRELIPELVDGLLYLVEEVLLSLSIHAPQIVTYLMGFLIGVINALAEKLPELIVAAVNLIGAFFRGVVDALKGVDTTSLLEAVAGIGLLSLMMLALAAVASLVPAAMVGVLAVGAVIAEMALVLAAIGALAQIPGLEWLINEGGDFLAAVGSAIGKFIGGIAGGALEGATSVLPKIGEDLSAFMENAKGFIDGAKQIDADMMAGVRALAETVLILTAADVLDGLTRWFTGGSSLSKFGEELSEFGPYIRQYARDVDGIDTSVVSASANAASILSEMAAKLPNSGGIVSWFTGDNKLSDFGKELAAFGPYISEYAKAVGDVKPEAIEASVNAARAMSELASGLPNAGGVASWFTGDNTLSDFGRELAGFAPHIATYSDHVKNVDAGAVKRSAGAVLALAEIGDSISNEGGIVSWFTGDNTLGKFGENLANLGLAIARYSESMAQVGFDHLGKANEAVRDLVDMAQGMKNVSFAQMANFSFNLKLLADGGIEKFIQAFSDAREPVRNAMIEFVNSASEAIKGKKEELKKVAEEAMRSIELGITGQRDAVLRAVTAVCTAIKDETTKHLQDAHFLETGRRIITTLAKGMAQLENLPASTMKSILRKAADAATQFTGDFERAGENVVNGLARGISGNAGVAAGAAANAGRGLLSSLKESLGISSPSKEGEKIGAFTDEGIIAGLLGKAKDVTSAGTVVGSSLTTALNDSLAGLSEDMLADPVIRPVVDLSEVQRSAGLIGGMFGTGQTLALAGNVSAGMVAYADQRNQNDMNAVTAGLRNEMANLRETVGELKRSLSGNRDSGNLAGSVGSAVREALSGVSVTMDGQRVGKLVTDHQNSATRRHGSSGVLR